VSATPTTTTTTMGCMVMVVVVNVAEKDGTSVRPTFILYGL